MFIFQEEVISKWLSVNQTQVLVVTTYPGGILNGLSSQDAHTKTDSTPPWEIVSEGKRLMYSHIQVSVQLFECRRVCKPRGATVNRIAMSCGSALLRMRRSASYAASGLTAAVWRRVETLHSSFIWLRDRISACFDLSPNWFIHAMANKEEKADEKQSSWKDAIYNPRTGEFIGRTASSWGE